MIFRSEDRMTATMNLCGHGTYRGAALDPDFVVPEHVEIQFYTAHDQLYDNAFEPYIRQGGDLQVVRAQSTTTVAIEPRLTKRQVPARLMGRFANFNKEIVTGGQACKNYRLGYGFGLAYCFLEHGANSIKFDAWSLGTPQRIYFDWGEDYDVFVGKVGLQVPLSEFCGRVAGGDSLRIRWFACREAIGAHDSRGVFGPTVNEQLHTDGQTAPSTFKTLDAMLASLELQFGTPVIQAPVSAVCDVCNLPFPSKMKMTQHKLQVHR